MWAHATGRTSLGLLIIICPRQAHLCLFKGKLRCREVHSLVQGHAAVEGCSQVLGQDSLMAELSCCPTVLCEWEPQVPGHLTSVS